MFMTEGIKNLQTSWALNNELIGTDSEMLHKFTRVGVKVQIAYFIAGPMSGSRYSSFSELVYCS